MSVCEAERLKIFQESRYPSTSRSGLCFCPELHGPDQKDTALSPFNQQPPSEGQPSDTPQPGGGGKLQCPLGSSALILVHSQMLAEPVVLPGWQQCHT
jgi:hypothetical protein